MGRDNFPNSQQTSEKIPNFGDSRFQGSSKIPDPVKIFIVFPIHTLYFGQIPDPENTLQDPVIFQDLYVLASSLSLIDVLGMWADDCCIRLTKP